MDSGHGKIAKIIPTIALFFSLPLGGQTPRNTAFEVATVRLSAPDARGGGRTVTDTRVDYDDGWVDRRDDASTMGSAIHRSQDLAG